VSGSVAFVGREHELSCLSETLSGEARLLLVMGDAGIGKTRFVGEGMRRAAAQGMCSVWGACLPLAEKLSLLPVAEALGELARLDGGKLLATTLEMAPPYVRVEMVRLLPQLGIGGAVPGGRGEEGQRERLFAAVAELLGAAARRCRLAVVIEDVHWADSATLDLLTVLTRAGRGAVRVVVTCRSDEVPLESQVAAWLAHVRGASGVEEIRLRPLSRQEAAEQIAALAGAPAPEGFAEEVYARAEGNPFFTEQLVAAAVPESGGSTVSSPAQLPARLAELLAARVDRCGGDARAALGGLAVAGRPLTEDQLCGVTGLGVDAVQRSLRELAAARLLADATAGGTHRPRHALLAEAAAAGLLPGERAVLHERTAQTLGAAGDPALAAETAGHWAAAGRPAEELPARVTAAEAAERVFGYAEAAGHWLRAIELCQALPGTAHMAGIDMPRLHVRAIDALEVSGDLDRAQAVAEEALHQFKGHPAPATAAIIGARAGYLRAVDAPAAGLALIEEALPRFEEEQPSAEQAKAWYYYGQRLSEVRPEESLTALARAMEIASAAGASSLIPLIMADLAFHALLRGEVGEGFGILDRGRALAEASGDGAALLRLAVIESDIHLKMGKFESAIEVALRGLEAARQTGRQESFGAAFLAANAAEALLAQGRTAEAAVLIDPLTTGPPDRNHWFTHESRAEIDLLRGDLGAAGLRQQQIGACIGQARTMEWTREAAVRAAELALWTGRPADALREVQRPLALADAPDLTVFCGRLLAAGMRACADLAERARARRDDHAAHVAVAAAADLASWVDRMGGAPLTDHPFVATIPAERATWDAERARLVGPSDPGAWGAAGKTWQDLGCPHRAGYAWWRQAEAQLSSGQPPAAATAAVHAAAAAADGHAPLLAQVRALAERARIPPHAPHAIPQTPSPAEALVAYGLTGRELAVLRLLAAGRTNAQIGAELYISPATAGVHVSNILRKLGVSGRVQAAALAERAGLLAPGQP